MGCRKLVKGEYMKKVYIYIVEPHPNLIGKFKPELNLILAEPEPEPCDLDPLSELTEIVVLITTLLQFLPMCFRHKSTIQTRKLQIRHDKTICRIIT